MVAIDDAEAAQGVVGALEWCHARVVVAADALWARSRQAAPRRTAAAQLLVELLLEALAEQVQGEGVDARVGEGQDAGTYAGHVVGHGGVGLGVVVAAVQVDDMAWEPTDSEQGDEHQHRLG